jgi:hypothetical protein
MLYSNRAKFCMTSTFTKSYRSAYIGRRTKTQALRRFGGVPFGGTLVPRCLTGISFKKELRTMNLKLRKALMFQKIAGNMRLLVSLALGTVMMGAATLAGAQTSPTANTFSTIAGGYTGTYTTGAVCGGSTSGSTYVATNALGDGCPGQYAKFGATGSESGMGVDGAGNVYVMDTTNLEVRKVDAKSGIVTRVAGGGTNCGSGAGQNDSFGAGCPNLQTTLPGAGYVRGMNVDSWGNVIVPAYSGSVVEIVCLSQSPLCPNTPGRKQVGYTYRIAGCVITPTGSGTAESAAAYAGGDGSVASPFENLAGDVADWGAGAVVGATGTQACSTTIGSVSQPRNATADRFGNVWIADTGNSRYRVVLGPASYNGVTNPLYAVIQLNPKYATAHYGYIYPVMGTFTAFTQSSVTYNVPTTAGGACSSAGATPVSTDAYGDGCPFFATTTGGSVAGLTVDLAGNAIFLDNSKQLIRVLYVGGTQMASLIKTLTGLTAVAGTVYALEGNGTASLSTTPVLTTAAGNFSYDTKGAVDQYGNIYIGNNSATAVFEIDAVTGYMRTLFASGTKCAAAKDTIGDGCIAGSAPFTSAGGSIGMAIGVDNLNNVYLADNQGYVRKVLSTALYPTAVGSSFTQSMLLHEPVGTTSITAALVNASPGITISGTPTCVLNTASTSDSTADCTVMVLFAPTVAGAASATLAITNVGGSGATTLYPVNGTATDAALVTDTAAPATATYATFGASATPTSLAFDGAGNLYTIDNHAATVDKISATGSVTTVGASPSGANQVAVDPAGNVYVTAIGSTSITKFALTSTGSYAAASTSTAAVGVSTVNITAYSITSNVATFTAANTLAAGQSVTLSGFATSTFLNGQTVTVLAAGLSSTQFEANLTNANVGATPESGSASTAAGVASPQGIVFDAQGNLYVSDATTKAVYQVPNDAGGGSLQSTVTLATGLANPTLLALDGLGNLLIADTGKVYRVNTSTGVLTTVLSSVTPVGLAADAGGNVYVQDSGTSKVIEVPYQAFAGTSVTVLTGETTPHGVAVDGKGQVYVADSGLATPAIVKVLRASETYTFPTGTSTYSGTFTNTGNLSSTGYAQTDSSEFPYTGTGTGGCGTISGTSVLLTGGACIFSVTPNLGNNGALVTNTTTLLPAASIGSLALSAQEPSGTTYTTTTTISGAASATYSTGAELTFTVGEVASDSTTQTGMVAVTLQSTTATSGTTTNYTLTNGAASVPLSGLTVGSYTIYATYPGNGTYLTSTSTMATFSITQAATSVSWTPGSTTQQYSAAVGTSVLNATGSVPGVLIYTATPAGGSAQNIHSASYLPIGTYTLGVTLVPTDATDYAQSTSSVANYSVTKANTTAGLGATQMLVASDGTGNYTGLQAAINALPSGGSVYVKPGTYTGSITVVQPNISLRGLGGDPTQVILSHSGGAFANGQVQNQYAGEFNVSQNNSSQLPAGSSTFTGDEASATIVVAKGINTALSTATQIPNGFYAENLTLLNTYNTASTLTNTYVTGGACTANTGQPTQTYSALYNAGIECGSQALAIWITSDLAVMNNVYTTSLQDTIYAASQGSGSNGYVPARQYWFRGKVTGDVDYIFGDAAAVFDSTSVYSAFHGTATGTVTIHAQNKAVQTGAAGDYLSGYIMNNDVFTSQSTGMTGLYFGRPYGTYSTWIMLNSYVDQVNAAGYTTGLGPLLGPTTFTEYNDIPYTDPATGSADINGNLYIGTGGNAGSGVTGTRENTSTNPGTAMANNNPPTSMTLAQAQAYFPTNFLSQTVSSVLSSTANWNPTAALATNVNAFTSSATATSIAGGSSVTLVMRPQTPGLGAIVPTSYSAASPTAATWTIPSGSYTLSDTYNSATTTLASGSLDASGEAYFVSSSLGVGTHKLTWTYSGDSNFSGSTSSTYTLLVTGASTATTLSGSGVTYGQSASVKATVSASAGTPTGTVTLTIDGATTQMAALSGGTATFTVVGLTAGNHSFAASYAGGGGFSASTTSSNLSLAVSQAMLTVTGICINRLFDQRNTCAASVATYQYSDTAATVFVTAPTGTTTALPDSPSGPYIAMPTNLTLTSFGSTNYTVTAVNGSFTITGGVPQSILFATLPNFAHGASYQLTARTTSGLPVTYTVTSGNTYASVSGSILTVNSAGPVTIQATTATDPTGDYATATAVSRSFTAQ